MVRLKGFRPCNYLNKYKISIPYGAIKREDRQKYFDLVREISIPYGAIKRESVQP